MKVYLSPCGIGLGHVGRCIPIAKELKSRGAEIVFSTYRDGVKYVEREKFPLIKVPPIGFKVKPDGTVDFKQTAVNPGLFAIFTLLKQIKVEVKIIKNINPDVVVSDSRVSPLIAARLLGVPRLCILNQFQIIVPRKKRFLRVSKLVDAGALAIIGKIWTTGMQVLIPDFPSPFTISMGNLHIPNSYRKRVKLIGPILPLHPNSLPDSEVLRKQLGLQSGKPVIFAPISGPLEERFYLIQLLQKIFMDFPKDYQIVMSQGYPNAPESFVRYGNARIFRWISNRFEYLKACDLVISRAGHGTLMHSICYGKPMILIPTPNHTEQLNNAKRATELGVAKMIEQENLCKETLLQAIKETLNNEEMKEKVKDLEKMVSKIDGLKTAVESILNTC
jgi:UDP:flavonoid glycosyltransferase YjiC (YdhE family)